MRIRKKKWEAPELAECPFYTKEPDQYKGKWMSWFKKEQPIHLEVGCGKGTFAGTMAKNHPDINYIAVDIKEDMLGVARRNVVKIFGEQEVNNLVLVQKNCEQIGDTFSSEDNIERMYINFCNPWPREKHKKRRLTFPRKLVQYREFLPDNGEIHFKTDDDELFEESIEYFKECNFEITEITYDLHNSDIDGGPMTEHEKMFSDEGIKIKYLTAVKK